MGNRMRVWPAIAVLLLVVFHAQSASAGVLVDTTVTFPGLTNVPKCTPWEIRDISIRESGVVRVSIWLMPYVGQVGWSGGGLFIPILTQEMGSGGWSGWGAQSRYCCAPVTPEDLKNYGSPQTGKWIQNGVEVQNLSTGVQLYTESLARQDRTLEMQYAVMPRCYGGGGTVYGMTNQDPGQVRLRVEFFPDSAPPEHTPASPPVGAGDPTPSSPLTVEPNTDRWGSDYKKLPGMSSAEGCRSACAADPMCDAYSYVKSRLDCYLKKGVPSPTPNNDIISGVRSRAGQGDGSAPVGPISGGGRENRPSPIPPTGKEPRCAEETVVYTNNNVAGVENGPTQETRFRLTQLTLVTYLMDYHWNGGRGQPPGEIGLRSEDGTMHGPWQAGVAAGQGGVRNAYWIVRPNVVLEPGEYTVVDSHPHTWAQNAESNGQGIVEVKGCGPQGSWR